MPDQQAPKEASKPTLPSRDLTRKKIDPLEPFGSKDKLNDLDFGDFSTRSSATQSQESLYIKGHGGSTKTATSNGGDSKDGSTKSAQ